VKSDWMSLRLTAHIGRGQRPPLPYGSGPPASGKLSVTVPTFLRLIEACLWAKALVEDHLRPPLHSLSCSWSLMVQGK
jgi:hypothetical protein